MYNAGMEIKIPTSAIGLVWITLVILKALECLTWKWGIVLLFPIWFPIIAGLAVLAASIVIVLIIVILVVVIGSILCFFEGK
jgi:hypothetical protein